MRSGEALATLKDSRPLRGLLARAPLGGHRGNTHTTARRPWSERWAKNGTCASVRPRGACSDVAANNRDRGKAPQMGEDYSPIAARRKRRGAHTPTIQRQSRTKGARVAAGDSGRGNNRQRAMVCMRSIGHRAQILRFRGRIFARADQPTWWADRGEGQRGQVQEIEGAVLPFSDEEVGERGRHD